MGIFLDLDIAKSVTVEEWEKVYEETLAFVENLPFAAFAHKCIHGVEVNCLIRAKEHERPGTMWNEQKSRVEWITQGMYDTLTLAEDFPIPRKLAETDEDVIPDAADAMSDTIVAYLENGWNANRKKDAYYLWGGKTQGGSYHMSLLVVACLIASRLGEKAFVHGDITRGQCKKAVEILNQYHDKSIKMPDNCDVNRLANRILKMSLSQNEKLKAYDHFYLGTKNREYGDAMRKYFPEDVIDSYWKEKFSKYEADDPGFGSLFREYMMQGFDLEKLCGYVKFENEDGEDIHRKFVECVLDAKLHIKEKDCSDPVGIDPESEVPYSIWTLLGQIGFAGARNKKVDRYIPIEEVRRHLQEGLKAYDDVNEIIDEYLEKEAQQQKIDLTELKNSEEALQQAIKQDASEVLNQILDQKKETYKKETETYDFNDTEYLLIFKKGDTIHPRIEEALGRSQLFLETLYESEGCKELKSKPVQNRCEWLVKYSGIWLRDKDWEKIFTDIEQNPDSFDRYYSLTAVEKNGDDLIHMATGLMINDDLYEHTKLLAAKLRSER